MRGTFSDVRRRCAAAEFLSRRAGNVITARYLYNERPIGALPCRVMSAEPHLKPLTHSRNNVNDFCCISRGVAEAKCILVTAVCVSVCLSFAAFLHYWTDPDVSWRNSRECPLVVNYWADLQSVRGFRCCDSIAPNAKCRRVLVLALCLVYCSA